VLDRERILAKLDEMDGYLRELESIVPRSIEEYRQTEKRRACERLLQISVECVIDVCNLLVVGLRLGLPAEEDDLFEKLEGAGVISAGTRDIVRRMKGCRNILVHEYGRVLDEIIFEAVTTKVGDFRRFRQEMLQALAKGTA
jgi:uncharacterized protein YutE (UPF0331/DUF86 family)